MFNRKYNFIYTKLVQEPDDLVGLLAYGIYKNNKIKYIKSFIQEHGREPTDSELANFHKITSSEEVINGYLSQAESKFSEFTLNVFRDKINSVIACEQEAHHQTLQHLLPSVKSYIVSGIVGNLAFMLFTAIIIWLVILFKADAPALVVKWLISIFQ